MMKDQEQQEEEEREEPRKVPRVGAAYQQDVGAWDAAAAAAYAGARAGAALRAHGCVCTWDGARVDGAALAAYLAAAEAACVRVGAPALCVRGGSVHYSIERALATLAARFRYDAAAGARALAAMADAAAVRAAVLFARGDECRWPPGDERLFAYAYRRCGSDFDAIAAFLAPDHSVAAVQRFYYTWKRSARYYAALYPPSVAVASKRPRSSSPSTSDDEENDDDNEQHE